MIDAALERDLPIPKSFEDPPAVREELLFYWNAFADLCTCRPPGAGQTCIPWRDIKAYADHAGLTDPDAFGDFRSIIGQMDDFFVDHLEKRREAERKHGGQGHQDSHRPPGGEARRARR